MINKEELDIAFNIRDKLITLGYYNNLYLSKYIELVIKNINTKHQAGKTQEHHIIPVSTYSEQASAKWGQAKRLTNLKIARKKDEFGTVHLLYKDHLLAHAYLTLCQNLDIAQQEYESKNKKRSQTSKETAIKNNAMRDTVYVHSDTEVIAIPIANLDFYLANGYALGAKNGSKRCYVHKNNEYKCIKIENLVNYLENGWIYGAAGYNKAKKAKKLNKK